MGIRLRDDVFFSDPESRIREYCEIEVYDGYDDRHTVDNVITKADIESANRLFAMINQYDKTESRRLLAQSGTLSPLIAEIPTTPIYGYTDEKWSSLRPKLESLLRKMTSIYGIGVAKATKILHLKRPQLFPVLDSYVVQFLTAKTVSSSPRDSSLALKTLDVSREIIRTQLDEFTKLQTNMSDLPISLTIVRLFDILCWSTYKWDILKKTTTPKGRASKSLLGPRPKRFISKIKVSKPRTRIKPSKALETGSSEAPIIVIDFYIDLCNSAKYDRRGEKPLAVYATVKYLKDTEQAGIRFLDLLKFPYDMEIRKKFIDVAERYGKLKSASGSWNNITGSNRELQNLILDNGKINQAFADLSPKDIVTLYSQLSKKYAP